MSASQIFAGLTLIVGLAVACQAAAPLASKLGLPASPNPNHHPERVMYSLASTPKIRVMDELRLVSLVARELVRHE